jgi:hypothetical protein
MKIPAALKAYVEIFQALDGYGQLWCPSGQYLGRLSSDLRHPNSITNPRGKYGSPYSPTSIHNPQCPYGSSDGIHSPFNPHCRNSPIVLYRGQPLLVVTSNSSAFTNGLKTVDPYLMLTIYEELAHSMLNRTTKAPLPYSHLLSKTKQLTVSSFGLPLAS